MVSTAAAAAIIGGEDSVPGRYGSRLYPEAGGAGCAEAFLWSATTTTTTTECGCFEAATGVGASVGVSTATTTAEAEATIVVLPIIVTTQCRLEGASIVIVTAITIAEVTIAVGEAVGVRGLGSDNPRPVAAAPNG